MAKILVLEQDPIEAWTLQAELTFNGGHTVVVEDDPAKALPRVIREECDLIIADWVRVDGNWLVKELRRIRPGHTIPVIMVGIQQACTDANVVESILRKQYGCDNYVPKPFDPVRLVPLVDVLLLRRKIRADLINETPDASGDMGGE